MYQLSRRLLSVLTTALSAQVLIGFSFATGIATALHFWIALFGVSLPVTTGLLLAVAVGFGVAAHISSRITALPQMLWAAFAVWVAGLPLFADLTSTALGFAPIGWLENDRALTLISAFCAMLVVGIPLALGFVATTRMSKTGQLDEIGQPNHPAAKFISGSLIGTLVFAFVIAPLYGVYVSALIGLAIGLLGIVADFLNQSVPEDTTQSADATHPPTESLSHNGLFPILILSATGILLAGLFRMAQQLVPVAEYIVFSVTGIGCFAIACGYRFSGWAISIRSRSIRLNAMKMSTAILTIALVAVAAIAMFPWLVSQGIRVNARVSSVPLVMLARLSMIGVFAIPIFFAIGRVANNNQSPDNNDRRSPAVLSFLIVGFAIGLWLSSGMVPLQRLLPATAIAIASLAVVVSLKNVELRRSKLNSATLVVAGTAIIASPWFADRFQPATAAHMLFSSRVAMASLRDQSSDILHGLDDTRLLATEETQAGIRTAWRVRGSQIQFQLNGVIDGYAATAASVCPKHSAEVLPAVVPLVLHNAPTRVATLGLGSGELLNTILAFPVLEVHSVATEKSHHAMLTQLDALPESSVSDERLVEHFVDPVVGIRALPTQLDVIISNPPDSSRPMGVSHFTQAFYQQAADHLAADGIFCQRFKQIDYGPAPFETVMATLHDVFKDVMAVEASSGDMVLVGTNSEAGLVRDGLIARLQRPQVLSVLGEAGWDWSLVLSQPALRVNPDKPSSDEVRRNTVANGSFAFQLPQEMMRWGQKMVELRNQLAPRTNQILTWVSADENKLEASKRMAESVELHELIAGFPDEPWSYRHTLKARMTRHPRPPVENIVNGKLKQQAHPIDTRRIEYLQALSRAIKTLDEKSIAEVTRFAEPYDPMISYFLHHEVASIYARLPQKNHAAEFAHLLHTIYYADGADRSVRNAAKAIQLLADHPEVLSGPEERWDNMNALLQIMVYRWENRNTIEAKSSQVALNDIEQSLSSMDAGIECLQNWAAEANIDEALVDARSKYLARSLVRPLGTYRGELLVHYEKRRGMAEKRRDKELSSSAN